MTDIVVAGFGDLRRLGLKLQREAPEIHAAFLEALEVGGELVAERACRNAATFSRRIPATVRTRPRGNTLRVQAGGAAAPGAAPIEHHGMGGEFRHPVFGNREVWVSQPAHPFLTPAAEESMPEVEVEVLTAVDRAVARTML